MIEQILVDCGLAMTRADAGKLIQEDPRDFDLVNSYFIAAELYNLRSSPITTQKLFEKALSGDLVIIGTKRIPSEMEFMLEVFTTDNFDRI